MKQEPLPDVEPLPPPPPQSTCSWCSNPATDQVEVKPASHTTNHHGKRVVKTSAVLAACCRECKLRLENRKAKARQEKEMAKEVKKWQ